jgi:hypothetical protein
MRSRKRAPLSLGAAAAALCLHAASGAAVASPSFGVRAGVNLDREDPIVGVELLAPLRNAWWANPNLEVTFGDHVDVIGMNADFHYDFERSGAARFWLGPGLAILFADHEGGGSDTDVGVNLLIGVGFPTSSGVVPYFQGKATVSDDTDGALLFGLRF